MLTGSQDLLFCKLPILHLVHFLLLSVVADIFFYQFVRAHFILKLLISHMYGEYFPQSFIIEFVYGTYCHGNIFLNIYVVTSMFLLLLLFVFMLYFQQRFLSLLHKFFKLPGDT